MNELHIKPVSGRVVRDPETNEPLKAEGSASPISVTGSAAYVTVTWCWLIATPTRHPQKHKRESSHEHRL